MTSSHLLIFVLSITLILCTPSTTFGSAVLPHAYSPATSPSPSPSPVTSPSPSPSHHHHHNHTHHHHHHNHTHHATSPSPAHSPAASPPHSSVMPPTHPPSAHSPVMPPTMAPSPAPYAKPPSKGPSPPPHAMIPRKLVAVEGVVYCKNCSYSGVDTLMGASPLHGATVELRCKNTKYMIKKTSTTDKNGFFFLQAPKHITTYGAHKCLVFLLNNTSTTAATSGAHNKCSHATNLNNGVSGAFLFLNKKMGPPPKPLPYTVYSVGPFAFEPSKCYKH